MRKMFLAKRGLALLLGTAVILSGGAFGGLEASAATGEWTLSSSKTWSYAKNIGGDSIKTSWDSSTVFSGSNVSICPVGSGSQLLGKLGKDDVFTKSGYVYAGAGITDSTHYSSSPGLADLYLYHSAQDAVLKQSLNNTYRLQPIMMKVYNYDYNYSGGGSASVNNSISFTDGSDYYTLDTSANRDMFAHNPTRDGYTFTGWYTSPDGGSRVSEYSTDNQTTLYAHWTANNYNLSTINGSGINSVSGSGSYQHGTSVTVSASVSAGHHFTGWSGTYSSGSNPYTFTMPIGNVTLTANAAPNTHSLSFVVDGKVVSSNGSVPYGAKVSDYTPSVPGKTGYAFSGWSNMPSSMPDYDVTVTGTYQANSYTITFISDGAAVKSTAIRYGDSISSVVPAISKPGYAFDGWYDAAVGGSPASLSGTYQKAGDTTVYAHWTPLYQYDASSSTFYIYSQDPSVISKWKDDGTVLGARKVVLGRDIGSLAGIPLSKFANMEEIAADSGNVAYAAEDGLLYSRSGMKLVFCPARHGDDPRISKSCTRISEKAFENCAEIRKVSVPYAVREIGADAFKGCGSLEALTIKNPDAKIDASQGTIPKSVGEVCCFKGSLAQEYCQANEVNCVLYDAIGDGFFRGEPSMVEFDIPDNVASIGANAFAGCANLKKVGLGNVKSIGANAFLNDAALAGVEIPATVEAIGKKAFAECSSLAEGGTISIPAGVSSIGEGAFANCRFSRIDFAGMDTETAWDDAAAAIPNDAVIGCYYGSRAYGFAKEHDYKIALRVGYEADGTADYPGDPDALENLASVSVGTGLASIGDNAFAGAGNLAEVFFEDGSGLASIGSNAFAGTAVAEIALPDSVKEIGAGIFKGCSSLESASLGGITEVPEDAFRGCASLTEVGDAGKWTGIGNNAFNGTAIKEFVAGKDVKYIGENAFADSALEKLTVMNPNCAFPKSGGLVPASAGIAGYTGSTADAYSQTYCGAPCESIGTAYKITLDSDGGAGGTESVYAVYGEKLDGIIPPAKDDYDFLGYYTAGGTQYYDAEGTGMVVFSADANETSLTAKWAHQTYTVIYDGNGSDSGRMDAGKFDTNADVSLAKNAYAKNGCEFLGWSTDPDAIAADYMDREAVNGLAASGETVTLYAVWNTARYTIAYSANGGRGTMESQTARRNFEVSLNANAFSREGYTFIGWSLDSDARSADYADGQAVKDLADAGMTVALYAVWAEGNVERFTLSYDANGGEMDPLSVKAFDGYEFAITDAVPEREGRKFAGWSYVKGSARADYASGDPVRIKGDTTLYAVWTTSGDTAYALNIHTQNADGAYETEARKMSADAGAEIAFVPGVDFAVGDGYYVDEGASTLSRTIAEGTEYDVYLNRSEAGVSYDLNAPDATIGKIPSATGRWGSAIVLDAPMPQRPGYTFVGWAAEKDGGEPVTEVRLGREGATVYAIWKEKAGTEPEPTEGPAVPTEAPDVTGTPIPAVPTATPATPTKKPDGPAGNRAKVTADVTIGSVVYRVAGKNAAVKKASAKKIKKAIIRSSVKIGGKKYKVTSIDENAFKNCRKLKTVSIHTGKLAKIGKNAFRGCKKLKTVVARGKRIAKVEKGAFKGVSKKVVIKTPKSRSKKYKKMLKKAGLPKTARFRNLKKTK